MEPLKNLFSSDLVGWIAFHLKHHLEGFDEAAFQRAVLQALPALELKERSQLIADHLVRVLPIDRTARHAILLAMLHPDEFDHVDKESDRLGLCGWAVLPLTLVVGQHGTGDFTGSLETLRQMTKRFTSEFAIRYFLIEDQAAALEIMSRWIFDSNRHVRRLVSEGTRPRLPWAMRLSSLMNDPSPVLPILQALRDDPEPYVRRSVANHLNDISKDHPGLLAEIAERWMVDASPQRRSLLRHASRSLIKSGDARILAAFGRYPARLLCGALELSSRAITMPDTLRFAVEITSTADHTQELTVDYVVHFRKANGSLAPKVFKGSAFSLGPGEIRRFRRAHRFAEITTRKYYDGVHRIGLRINGADTEVAEFELVS
ncbi:DNA alkylation repair protein [Rhizobium sp. SEMIA 4085]|uniref:DNA alkylation repair protein n=1 Tax=Rhizobium gallicum bv. gallicum R602sp TaxID=1041138 RepID=A0A0B4XDU7_9HYPH|nr:MULTISPECIES: DNA alkylation repair protein [Rhizobium]AJD46179.1 DNA alkylation repair protein [Rhizobium gallicum bv. gallicum R602sp]NNH28538.1 DNA alkylation repair protein [Rhizobium sp. SEMIA 4085]TDW32397.1 3-methyladenine DNA glycosylase AlkC [Rhizobium azibense]